ncbi:MAG: acyltransferase [Vicinamibacterales bacterium]
MSDEPRRETIAIQDALRSASTSRVQKYCDLVVGERSWWALVRYETVTMLAAYRPGAFGLWLRAKLYPRLLKACGTGVVFGYGVVLRHPNKIVVGDDTIIDDLVVLDAKGTTNAGIQLGRGVFVGRHSILSCKDGDIVLGDEVNVGFNCEIFSAKRVTVGARTLLAAYTYLIGGDHDWDRVDVSVLEQGRHAHGIVVGEGAWLGAGAKVLDGVEVGDHSIVGAGAVVTKAVPPFAIAAGIPARIVKDRRDEAATPRPEVSAPGAGRPVSPAS